jgi:hypothetical protein
MSFIAPVIGTEALPVASTSPETVARQVPEQLPEVNFSSMQAFAKTAPEVYKKLMDYFAQGILVDMRRGEARRQARAKEAQR